MPEVRPIDANKAVSELRTLPEQERLEYMGVYDLLKSMPTLDYEPVVHCRDCKHRNKEYSETFCEVLGRLTNDNFYCRYGAKMDEEVKSNANNNS